MASHAVRNKKNTEFIVYKEDIFVQLPFAPHIGATREVVAQFDFDANAVIDTLESMEIPALELFAEKPTEVSIYIPGGVGDIIKDPDGGVWIHAERSSSKAEHAAKLQPVTVQALAVSA